jgi:endoglucanase
VLAALFVVASAQVVDFVNWPKGISDMAFNVTLSYTGFDSVFTGDMGMIVSLNTDIGDYLSDGKISLGSVGSGTAIVYIMPPLGFVNDNIGLNVTLRAFVIMYTDILRNVSTAYTYALKDQNLTGIPVTETSSFGSSGMLKFMGVNIGGGEIGAKYDSASALYFKKLGFNTFGLFTSWSRLVPTISTGNMKASEVTSLFNAVSYITNKLGAFCVLELHDYGRYSTDAIGNGVATQAAFVSVWTKLATLFKNNSRVIFNLMNEAHDQSTSPYVSALNAAIGAIRSTSGATNMIMIQGNRWNSAMNWLNVDEWGMANTETMSDIVDPLGNTVFNIHQYLDASHGGSFDGCISENIGSLYLSGITLWLRNNNRQAFLGEFGASNDSVCKEAVNDIIKYVEANSDVWIGWSWWNAGSFLADTSYTVQPTQDEDANIIPNSKQSWLTSHFDTKCPVYYSGASSAKYSSCFLLNGFEGNISADANSTTPTDETGSNQTTKNPGKVVKIASKGALSFALNEQILAVIMTILLVLSVLL